MNRRGTPDVQEKESAIAMPQTGERNICGTTVLDDDTLLIPAIERART